MALCDYFARNKWKSRDRAFLGGNDLAESPISAMKAAFLHARSHSSETCKPISMNPTFCGNLGSLVKHTLAENDSIWNLTSSQKFSSRFLVFVPLFKKKKKCNSSSHMWFWSRIFWNHYTRQHGVAVPTIVISVFFFLSFIHLIF